MSQSGFFGNGGGGGGGNITLNADNGTPLSGTSFNIIGAKFGLAPTPVSDTYTSSGDFFVENRAWSTPYVVDSNVTPGDRGTFSTIQAAIDQAVADGYTRTVSGLVGVIEIRSDNLIGDVNIPDNALIHIKGQTPAGAPDSNVFGSFIGGSITFGASALLILENIVGQVVSGTDFITVPDNTSACIMHQCNILDNVQINGNSSNFAAQGCTFSKVTLNSSAFTSNNPAIFINCSFNSTLPMSSNSYARFTDCILPSITLADNAFFEIYDCFNISGGDVITGSTTNTCFIDGFYGRSLSGASFLCNFTGSLQYSNVSVRGGGGLFGPNVTLIKSLESQGNYAQATDASSSRVIALGEYVIDVDTSGGAVTLSLPNNAHPDQEFIIVDSTRNAMLNPITINVNGGGTINGFAYYVIQSNGGSVCVKCGSAPDYTIVGTSKPYGNPQFLAIKTSTTTNATGDGTPYTIPYSNEINDVWGNFSTPTFTAPIIGLYQFNFSVSLFSLTTAHTEVILELITTNRGYATSQLNAGTARTASNTLTLSGSVIADMAIGDTASVRVSVAGSTKTVSVGTSYFSGNLINPLFEV